MYYELCTTTSNDVGVVTETFDGGSSTRPAEGASARRTLHNLHDAMVRRVSPRNANATNSIRRFGVRAPRCYSTGRSTKAKIWPILSSSRMMKSIPVTAFGCSGGPKAHDALIAFPIDVAAMRVNRAPGSVIAANR
jgi:hypothetical protein